MLLRKYKTALILSWLVPTQNFRYSLIAVFEGSKERKMTTRTILREIGVCLSIARDSLRSFQSGCDELCNIIIVLLYTLNEMKGKLFKHASYLATIGFFYTLQIRQA